MPQTLQIQAYTYDELNQKAKEKARAWYVEGMDNESYGTNDVLTENLNEAGLSGMKVWWSLNNCQGDGVAFEGNVDVDQFLKTQENLQYQIANNKNRYDHLISSEHVDPAVQLGIKATTGIDYVRDAAGAATKNEKGGYNCFVYMRPSEDGAVVTAIEDLNTRPPKVRITQESDASPECIERYKELALVDATVAFIKMLLERDVTLAINIKHRGRYTHWNSMEVSVEATDYGRAIDDIEDSAERNRMVEEVDNTAISIQEGLKEFVKDISRNLERQGYDNIEGCTSEEAVADNITANDYLFTASGSRRVTLNADAVLQPAV